jgi:hypothetical protein
LAILSNTGFAAKERMITITGKTALVTGSSRAIGRRIALKLAECGVDRIGVHYLKNRAAADDTASKLCERGAEPLLIQADVTKVDDRCARLRWRRWCSA